MMKQADLAIRVNELILMHPSKDQEASMMMMMMVMMIFTAAEETQAVCTAR
jgi:hypothetical protein